MFVGRSSARRIGLAALLGALPLALGACGLLIGLEDHQPFPEGDAGDLPDAGTDALPDVLTDACADTTCEGACVDTLSDAANCGGCGVICGQGFTCDAGVCGDHIDEISAGANHGCVLLHDGSIWCWGNDSSGQLGIPAASDETCEGAFLCHPAPIKVPGLTTKMVQVSAGSDSTCALDTNGGVWCWGLNDSLQLGRPSAAMSNIDRTPVKIPGLPPFAQVSTGYRSACARVKGGSAVYCWGSNESGALGNGLVEGKPGGVAPGVVASLTGTLVDVSSSFGGHACALNDAGQMWCWGLNSYGQLGHDSMGDSGMCPAGKCNSAPFPVNVSVATRNKIATSVAGTCAGGNSGFVCWGANLHGQLGTSVDGQMHPSPALVPLGSDAIAGSFQSGYATSCVVTTSGGVNCRGDDSFGGLGRGAIVKGACSDNGACDPTLAKVLLPAGFKPTRVAGGAYWAMALSSDNHLVAWGANLDARLGHLPGTANDLKDCGFDGQQICNATPQPVPQPGAAP